MYLTVSFIYVLCAVSTSIIKGSAVLPETGPEVINLFSCSIQLSMKLFLLIYVLMPTIVGILTFTSRKIS